MSLDSVFASSTLISTDKNRQHIFDDDVLHYFLTKIDLSNTERVIFASCLVNRYRKEVNFAFRIRTLIATEYLPSDIFTLLASKLCDEINGCQVGSSRDILLVLRDTIDAGKNQMGIKWGSSQKLCRWLTQEDVEQRNSQSPPGGV